MKEKQYKYDAFISYRHNDLDKFVAENLHRLLETYELPKNIKEKLGITGRTIKRVFRDQEELPLSSNLEDPIIEALKESKYLIVICSPRLKDSLWCKKEIETFKKLRGRKNIFCVLIEGEPSDSFPEEVLYDEEIVKGKKTKKLVEPLAADVRGENKKEVLTKLKNEKLRLIAPMYNLDYDDLKQRHKLRKQKQMLNIFMAVSAFLILFAIYTSIMLIKITNQQKMLKNHQAITLANDAIDYIKNDSRYNAIKSSYEALTKYNGVKMPYTPEAEYALSESLGVYNAGLSYKAISEIETKGVSDYVKVSKNNKYFAIYDESEEINIVDSKKFKKVQTLNNVGDLSNNEFSFSFVGNDKFTYINKDGSIVLINIKDGKIIDEIKKNDYSYKSVRSDLNGNYISYLDGKKLNIYDVNEKKVVKTIEEELEFSKELYYTEEGNYLFAFTSDNNFDIDSEDYMNIIVISLENKEIINKANINASYVSNIDIKDNNLYLLCNRSIGTSFNAVLTSYNYIDGNINYIKSFDNTWGKYITRSYKEGTNELAIANYDTVFVVNAEDGNTITTFNMSSEIINIYAFINNNMYLAFNSNGSVDYLSMDNKESVELIGKYELNLERYSKVVILNDGFLLIPFNDNRVIYYEANSNKKIKEEDIKLDYPSDDGIDQKSIDKVKKQYDIKNKNLVKKVFYDNNKELMFVNYTNDDIAIYNVKDKKILNTLSKVGNVNHYFGKDKYGRIYIGDVSDSYILDSNYNKVGHIKGLAKLEKDRVIISSSSKYYSLPIYTLNDLLKEAEKYLK